MRALTNADPLSSALAEHAIVQRHNIAWTEVKILDSNPLLYQRCAIEAWHIRAQTKAMNRSRDWTPPPVYDSLIRPSHPS